MTVSSNLILERAIKTGERALLETDAERLARIYGISVVRSKLSHSEKEALAISRRLGYPVALKIVSPDVLHKTDIGGVVLGLQTPTQTKLAYRKIIRNTIRSNKSARLTGVLIQKMAAHGQEFVVGATRDPQFGPTVMFGLGGIYVEMFRDVSFRFAPLAESEAIRMISELRCYSLFQGFRGSKPLDLDATAKVIIAVGAMIADNDSIESLDVNPLFVYPKGATTADVRVILKRHS